MKKVRYKDKELYIPKDALLHILNHLYDVIEEPPPAATELL
jgi:hypothetical protein